MKRVSLLRAVLRALSILPLPVAHAIGAPAGQIAYLCAGRLRRIAMVNLRLCFPELPETERRRLAAATFRELGKQLMETGIIWHAGPRRLRRLVKNPESLDALAGHWPAGRGLLLAGPHLGNWELVSLYINQRFPIHGLYRPPRARDLEPLLVAARQRTGAIMMPATARGIRTLYKALRAGSLVGILPDQEPKNSGVFAPFFGVQTRTMTLLGQMASKTGAPVVFTFMQRLPWGRGFHLHLIPGSDDIHSSDPEVSAGAVNAGVEQCVRIAPAQYQWTYKRFRQQPDGGSNRYK